MDPRPKFGYRDKVMLARAVSFFRRTQFGGRQDVTMPKGHVVEVKKPEVIYNDHGHFSYIQYHLEIEDGWWPWRATVMESSLCYPDVLDRLANL